MKINAISSQAFGGSFAIDRELTYTPRQESLVNTIEQDLHSKKYYDIGRRNYDNICDSCHILAKPAGKNGIFFQACVEVYDPEKGCDVWYDEVLPYSKLISKAAHTKKDALRIFNEVVDKLQNLDIEVLLSDWDWDRMDVREPMENPPQNIFVLA